MTENKKIQSKVRDMQPVRIACLVSWTVLQFEKKHSLFIVEIMDEKTYRSIVQATQADTAENFLIWLAVWQR